MEGIARVSHYASDTFGTVELNLIAKPYTGEYKDKVLSLSAKIPLQQERQSLVTKDTGTVVEFKVQGTGNIEKQLMRVQTTLADQTGNTVYIAITNVDPNPIVCGLEATVKQDKDAVKKKESMRPVQPASSPASTPAAARLATAFAAMALVPLV